MKNIAFGETMSLYVLKQPRLAATMVSLVGIAFILSGCLMLYKQTRFVAAAGWAEGTVMGIVPTLGEQQDLSRPAAFSLKVGFMTDHGRYIEFVTRTNSDSPSHKLGDRVPVGYDRLRPECATIWSFADVWLHGCLQLAVGSILLAAGGTMLGIARRKA